MIDRISIDCKLLKDIECVFYLFLILYFWLYICKAFGDGSDFGLSGDTVPGFMGQCYNGGPQ
jgi:hypothetical protein